MGQVIKLGETPEAALLAGMLCEGPEKRRVLFHLALDRLPPDESLKDLIGTTPAKLQAVLALQLDQGLKLGVLQAGLEWWPAEIPHGRGTQETEARGTA